MQVVHLSQENAKYGLQADGFNDSILTIKPIIPADLSMIIYSMGILDMGKNETWIMLE